MTFDFAPLLPAGLPPPATRWSGLAKYNFTGGNNDADEVPVDGLMAAADAVIKREGRNLATYNLAHGPQGYRFGDVRTSIDAAVRAKVALALVILVMPGLTDRGQELDAIVDLADELPPGSQLILRDLACDPKRTIELLRSEEPAIGIANALDRIRTDAPQLRIGALVRPLARV